MADMDASLRGRQPWQAAFEHDYGWLGNVITKHYHGDDNDVKVLMGGILHAFAGMTVDAYAMAAAEFLRGESAVVQSSPAETPTETSPCSTTPAGERVRACDCWCCTTTPSGSSTIRGGRKVIGTRVGRWLDSNKHQE
jgi:hypothetical protein